MASVITLIGTSLAPRHAVGAWPFCLHLPGGRAPERHPWAGTYLTLASLGGHLFISLAASGGRQGRKKKRWEAAGSRGRLQAGYHSVAPSTLSHEIRHGTHGHCGKTSCAIAMGAETVGTAARAGCAHHTIQLAPARSIAQPRGVKERAGKTPAQAVLGVARA